MLVPWTSSTHTQGLPWPTRRESLRAPRQSPSRRSPAELRSPPTIAASWNRSGRQVADRRPLMRPAPMGLAVGFAHPSGLGPRIGCGVHTVGGRGKFGENPARTRHCDRAYHPRARRVREASALWMGVWVFARESGTCFRPKPTSPRGKGLAVCVGLLAVSAASWRAASSLQHALVGHGRRCELAVGVLPRRCLGAGRRVGRL